MKFYLGTHHPHWLADSPMPLFISHRRLKDRRTLPRAQTCWALDSGAFSDITINGAFTTTPTDYINAIGRYQDQIGSLDWAAPQDHMCEPWVLARSTLADTVPRAQHWTVDNYLTLRTLDATLPIIPVLQGQTLDDYRHHIDMYNTAGINLHAEPVVGLGSVCRRQATQEIGHLVAHLSTDLRLHGFGVKLDGLRRYGWALHSADSMAWSYAGRRTPCPQSTSRLNCANCRHYAHTWHTRIDTINHDQAIPLTLW